MWFVLAMVALGIYLVHNLLVAMMFNVEDMKRHYIDGQCLVGMICANVFYSPAWFLKGLRFAIVHLVA